MKHRNLFLRKSCMYALLKNSFLFVLASCSLLTKQAPPDFLPPSMAAKSMQSVHRIGYVFECEATKIEKGKDQHEFCSSFAEKSRNEKDLSLAIQDAFQRQMPQFQFVPLRELIKDSDSFDRCYLRFLFFENLKFDDCLNDQDSKEKIQKKYNLDALAHLVIKISSKVEDKLSLKSLVPGLKDQSLHVDTSYYLKIVKQDSIKPVWIQVGSNYEGRDLSYVQVGSLQMKSSDLHPTEDPFIARVEMFFVDVKKSLGL